MVRKSLSADKICHILDMSPIAIMQKHAEIGSYGEPAIKESEMSLHEMIEAIIESELNRLDDGYSDEDRKHTGGQNNYKCNDCQDTGTIDGPHGTEEICPACGAEIDEEDDYNYLNDYEDIVPVDQLAHNEFKNTQDKDWQEKQKIKEDNKCDACNGKGVIGGNPNASEQEMTSSAFGDEEMCTKCYGSGEATNKQDLEEAKVQAGVKKLMESIVTKKF